MNIYSLDYSTNCYVNGDDHQLRGLFDKETSKAFIKKDYPNVKKEKLKFELNSKAKLTNCLSQGNIASGGLIVDEKLKTLFSNFNLMKNRFYPIMLIDEQSGLEVEENYYWLQLKDNLTSEIDFKTSHFVEQILATKGEKINIESLLFYEEQRKIRGWKWQAKSDLLSLKEDSALNTCDLFKLTPFDSTICISESLRNTLVEYGITGIELEKYKKVVFI